MKVASRGSARAAGALGGILALLTVASCGGGGGAADGTANPGTGTGGNSPPVLSLVADMEATALVQVGNTYLLAVSASDADGDPLTFTVTGNPAWTAFDSDTGTLSGVPAQADIGLYEGIVIGVSDGVASAEFPAITIEVIPRVNGAPVLTGTPPGTASIGNQYTFTPNADDPDADPLTFTIVNPPAWTSFDEETGTLSGLPTAADLGTYGSITLTVSDGVESDSIGPFSVEVLATANTAPQISGTPPSQVLAGQTFSFTPTASDAENATLQFAIVNRPPWASFSTATGTLSGTPGFELVGQTYTDISISVTDGTLSASLPPFDLNVSRLYRDPVANAGADKLVLPSTASVTLDGTGSSDPDGDALTYSWTQTQGDSVSLSDATAVDPTFTAPATAQDLYFSLVVNDGFGSSPADEVVIHVVDDISPTVTITTPQHPYLVVGRSLSFSAGVTGGNGAVTYSWTFAGGSPATGSGANPGAVTFGSSGSHVVTVTVEDEVGSTDTDTLNVTAVKVPRPAVLATGVPVFATKPVFERPAVQAPPVEKVFAPATGRVQRPNVEAPSIPTSSLCGTDELYELIPEICP